MKFPGRIVLGEGYPWAYGLGPYREVGLNEVPVGVQPMSLRWPKELWSKEVPQYRLILERIDDGDEE